MLTLGSILIILLVVLLIGALPTWPYSASWGAYPASGLLVAVIVLVLLVVMGVV